MLATCRDTPLIPATELPGLMEALPLWALANDSKSITRAFTGKNFMAGERGDAAYKALLRMVAASNHMGLLGLTITHGYNSQEGSKPQCPDLQFQS